MDLLGLLVWEEATRATSDLAVVNAVAGFASVSDSHVQDEMTRKGTGPIPLYYESLYGIMNLKPFFGSPNHVTKPATLNPRLETLCRALPFCLGYRTLRLSASV